jgi:hypothetical protein
MNILFILSFVFHLNSAFDVFDKEINSTCSSEFTGENGVCLEAKDCPAFRKSRNQLKICSFKHRVPIVCCPRQLDNREGHKRISAQSE